MRVAVGKMQQILDNSNRRVRREFAENAEKNTISKGEKFRPFVFALFGVAFRCAAIKKQGVYFVILDKKDSVNI